MAFGVEALDFGVVGKICGDAGWRDVKVIVEFFGQMFKGADHVGVLMPLLMAAHRHFLCAQGSMAEFRRNGIDELDSAHVFIHVLPPMPVTEMREAEIGVVLCNDQRRPIGKIHRDRERGRIESDKIVVHACMITRSPNPFANQKGN